MDWLSFTWSFSPVLFQSGSVCPEFTNRKKKIRCRKAKSVTSSTGKKYCCLAELTVCVLEIHFNLFCRRLSIPFCPCAFPLPFLALAWTWLHFHLKKSPLSSVYSCVHASQRCTQTCWCALDKMSKPKSNLSLFQAVILENCFGSASGEFPRVLCPSVSFLSFPCLLCHWHKYLYFFFSSLNIVYILKIAIVFLWGFFFFFKSGYFHYKWDSDDDTKESGQVKINHESWLKWSMRSFRLDLSSVPSPPNKIIS